MLNQPVTSFLSLFLLCSSVALTAGQPSFESHVIIPSDEKHFRSNAYPTVVTLPDGTLFLTWTATGDSEKSARIVGAFSRDGGHTWTPPEVLINTDMGDYDPNIILTSDEIQVYSTSTPISEKLIKHSEMWKTSRKISGGKWSKPIKMPLHHKYEVGKIHSGLTLPDGTLLMPYSWDIPAEEEKPADSEGRMKLKSGVLRSRDGGRSWTPGGDMFVETPRTSPFSTGGVAEPAMVLLPDGELFCLLRTSDVWHYQSRSHDGGLTWETPSPSSLRGHNTPSALHCLRDSGDVMVVWNNSLRDRWPLEVALSSDGCKTWSGPRTLVNSIGYQCSYPTATQAADGTLIAIWQQDLSSKGRREIRVARFSREWLLTRSRGKQAVESSKRVHHQVGLNTALER